MWIMKTSQSYPLEVTSVNSLVLPSKFWKGIKKNSVTYIVFYGFLKITVS